MKFRHTLLAAPVAAALSFGALAPAQAAPTDAVTNLTVHVTQTLGSHDSWTVQAAWTGTEGAAPYSVVIADHADGTGTAGKAFGNKDTRATTASLVTGSLAEGSTYWVAVKPRASADDPVVAEFEAPVLDQTAPSGTFKLDRTSAYLASSFTEDPVAEVVITQTAGEPGATRSVLAGDDTPGQPWTAGDGFMVRYTKPGTYHPSVQLTDRYGNTTSVKLGEVRILSDSVAPVVHITTPAKPGRIASWRTIRGTASDVGTGVVLAGVLVMEKRGSIWWVYDFRKRTWLKGYAQRQKSERKSKASPALVPPSPSGAWRSPVIKGMTKGTLHVEAIAIDGEINGAMTSVTHKVR